MRRFNRGDWIVFAKQKWSTSPGPRARGVSAAPAGEIYSYVVDKFWVVEDRNDDGELRLRTRTGKEHLVDEADPRLRHATIIEKLFLRGKFPRPT